MQRFFLIAPLALWFGLSLSIAGCGGEDVDTTGVAQRAESETASKNVTRSAPPDLDPCALISQSEIEQILGVSVDPAEPSAIPVEGVTYFSCNSDDVHIDVEAWGSAADAAASFEFATGYPGIEGIGDRARNTQPLGEIDVLAGKYVVSVNLFMTLDSEKELRAATEIARIVLERLP